MTADDVIDLAKAKKPIAISSATIPEVGLYYKMRDLYDRFDKKQISKELARDLKRMYVEEYCKWLTYKAEYLAEDKKRVAICGILCDANKNGCEICKKIAQLYDERLPSENI